MRLDPFPRLPTDSAAKDRKLTDLFRDIATKVNGLGEGRIVARHNSLTAMPTTGTYQQGDFVPNSTPSILGGAGNKYVVNGWIRLTSGSAHVLNTDWAEARTLTGT